MTQGNEETEPDLDAIGHTELLEIVWQQLGIRASPTLKPVQLREALWYNSSAAEPDNPVNPIRRTIMGFIRENSSNLSLPCDGNCFSHSDARVLACFLEFKRDVMVDVTPDELEPKVTSG